MLRDVSDVLFVALLLVSLLLVRCGPSGSLGPVFVRVEELFELCRIYHLYACPNALGVRRVSLLSAACSVSVGVIERHTWYGQK